MDRKELESKIKRIESAYFLSDSPLQRQQMILVLDELKIKLQGKSND